MENEKKTEPVERNIKTIIFDKTGTMIKGEIGISDLMNFLDGSDGYKMAAYNISIRPQIKNDRIVGENNIIKKSLNADDLESYLLGNTNAGLPSLILFLPKPFSE